MVFEANSYPGSIRRVNPFNIFDKAVFCLGERQGMLVNNECTSWYNRVGDF